MNGNRLSSRTFDRHTFFSCNSNAKYVKLTVMPTLNIKPTHKAITAYYAALDRYRQHGISHETAVRAAFQALLEVGARQLNWTLVCEYTLRIPERTRGTGPRATVLPGRRDFPVSIGKA